MGMMTEGQIRDQLKKGQKETAELLGRLIAEQQQTNQLLGALLQALSARPVPPVVPQAQPPVTWGRS
ncbi:MULTISPECIES: hypothetical protein [Streptomycetaceae]|uniref:Uncharacterized protein n=1 Tax=Streptantibioticus cattleyicolor (strain ATCC 35852 / DSM 46488 / JCM 4925 / NBRC 14057 / NRRL 8057) TaxID=1003195 RepID=F8K0N6_STREN|nr:MULTISPECIES: hypothetical protein [Streptomycetaceae]AEW94609.1 hypothetical protein SCATT_22380 [Streptantibioticus cattleyicolor NRRL 8057 = DSM 46488]MYS59247.1 hypothetical protein [Streptomyces sp. SID5468]CCB74966.1 protein of unknown function [Streptantibioticus cattleyicolor NRRL 8057 = DSM 46488]